MLFTDLDHLETDEALKEALAAHENVMISCGRMGPMCLPVYAAMEELRSRYPHVAFFDQDFDGPAAYYWFAAVDETRPTDWVELDDGPVRIELDETRPA
jgi:hypothetical protein